MFFIKRVTVLLFVCSLVQVNGPAWTNPKQAGQAKRFVLINQMYQIESAAPKRRSDDFVANVHKYFPDFDIGPKKHKDYDPSIGYEVYWKEGVWVYSTAKPEVGELCGGPCTFIYKDYGYICGRNEKFEYKSFENYCAMRTIDCNNIYKWSVAYRGKCRNESLKTFPTISKQVVTRAMQWQKNFSNKYTKKKKGY